MTRVQFLAFYEKLWQLPAATLKLDDRLAELADWDSLALLQTIVIMDRECGLKISGEQIKACRTLGEILALAGDRVAE